MRIINDMRPASCSIRRRAQFALTQVAQKAKHWQPTACDGSGQSKMAIKSTLISMIQGYARLAALRSACWG